MKKLLVLSGVCFAAAANAATDITGVITDVDGYMDAAIVVGIAILLFVIGRRVVQKLI